MNKNININKNIKKAIYLILTLIIIICVQSCGINDNEKNRTAFAPESGSYEIMLDPENWTVLEIDFSANQLNLFNGKESFLLTVDCYSKTGLSDMGVSSLDGFIEFYKTIENGKSFYENSEENTEKEFEELTQIAKKDIKNSDFVKSGKRQKVNQSSREEGAETETTETISEIVYLDTENYFFTLIYGAFPGKFDNTRKSVNDAIAHLKTK